MSDRLIPAAAPWLAGLFFSLVILLVLRRPLARLWRLFLRSAGGLAVLALLSKAGGLMGICLGVNWLNALILGLLGLPGFGLLLMLRWVLQTP